MQRGTVQYYAGKEIPVTEIYDGRGTVYCWQTNASDRNIQCNVYCNADKRMQVTEIYNANGTV